MEYICLSTVSVSEFYKQFCQVLGVSGNGGKTGLFRAIQEQIYYLYKEKQQPLLLAVDEAQYLNTGILNDIKMLFLSDTFWNAEKISQHLDNPFDVESLVAGIKALRSLDETT